MKQENYVSLEQAMTLKELGFHYPVAYWYHDTHDDENNPTHQYERVGADIPTLVQDYNNLEKFPISKDYFENKYSCPTLSLVQKWLREEKDLIIEARLYNPCNPIEFETVIYCNYDGHYFDKQFEGVYDTYEQALSVGIDKCLELLKNDIKDSYVTFEQAKLLQELGFPQKYIDKNYSASGEVQYYSRMSGSELCYACPTLSLVQKWLREERGVYVDVQTAYLGPCGYAFNYLVIKGDEEIFEDDNPRFTYEDALSLGITKALKKWGKKE